MIKDNNSQDIGNAVKRYSRDSITYGIAVIIPAIIGVMSIYLYTRIFSAEDFGEYNLIYSTTLLITTLFSQWIQQSVQRYRPEYKDNLRDFNSNLSVLLVLMIILIGTLGILLYPLNEFFGVFRKYYLISALLIITQFLYLTLGATIQASFKSTAFKNINLLNGLFKFGFSLLLIFYISKTPESIIIGLILSQILLIYPMFKIADLKMTDLFKTNLSQFNIFANKCINYGLPMIGWFLGNSILNLCDRYMILYYSSSKNVGIYSANYSIVSTVLGLLTSPLLMAAQPIIMNHTNIKRDKSKIEEMMTSFSSIFLGISLPLFIFVSIFHNEISSFFLGEEYREGSMIIPILFIGILLWDLGMFGHKGFELLKKTKLMLLLVCFSALINIILNFVFVPNYGYLGSSIATLLSMGLYPVLVFTISKKDIIRWNLDWRVIFKIALSSGAAGIIALLLNVFPTGDHSFLKLLIGGICGLATYLFMLLKTSVISVNLLRLLKQKITNNK